MSTLILVVTAALSLLLANAPAFAQPVGKGSCAGEAACTGNTGNIKNNACVGDFACVDNAGAVGNGACVLFFACLGNTGDIKNNACVGDQACQSNAGAVGNGASVGGAPARQTRATSRTTPASGTRPA